MPNKVPRRAAERRRTPRIRARHDLHLQVDDQSEPVRATSIDISLGGIYCHVEAPIPLFTKVMLNLTLPLYDANDKRHVFRVPVEGVVVRMEPEDREEGRAEYACALAFLHGDPDVELVIAKFVLQQLARGMEADDG